jgi:thioesterase domain-containing protein
MVEDYVEQILAVQPHGPFLLLGWSFGGVIAHAMAAELTRRGHDVALLALIASLPAGSAPATRAMAGIAEPTGPDEPPSEEVLAGLLRAHAETRWGRDLIDDPAYAAVENTGAAVMANNIAIMRDFVSPVFHGPTIVVIPTVDEPLSPEQQLSVWAPHLAGPVAAHLIPTTHNRIDEPDQMRAIGHILNLALQSPTK